MNAGLLLSTFGPGGDGWSVSTDAASSVTNLNKIFINIGVGIGALIIALAVLKLILSFSDQNSMSKMQASMMFGVGIFFMGISKVVDVLSVTDTTTVSGIVSTILTGLLGPIFTYIGAIVTVLAVFALIMSIAHENPDEQTKAQTLLAIGVACLGANSILNALDKIVMVATQDSAATVAPDLVVKLGGSVISGVAFYIGMFALILSIFRLIMAIRTEETRERDTAIRGLMVGIALISFGGVLTLFSLNDMDSYFENGWSSSASSSSTSAGSTSAGGGNPTVNSTVVDPGHDIQQPDPAAH
jgi:hypothetical protein